MLTRRAFQLGNEVAAARIPASVLNSARFVEQQASALLIYVSWPRCSMRREVSDVHGLAAVCTFAWHDRRHNSRIGPSKARGAGRAMRALEGLCTRRASRNKRVYKYMVCACVAGAKRRWSTVPRQRYMVSSSSKKPWCTAGQGSPQR